MLTPEEDVEISSLKSREWTISAIARHVGHDRKTVRAYLSGEREAGVRGRAEPDSFDRFEPYVRQRLVDDAGRWDDQLRELARAIRGMFQRHPRTASLALTRTAFPLPTVASFHRALAILRARGFNDDIAAAVVRSLISYASGYGLGELTCLAAPGRQSGEASADATDLLLALGRALPADTPRELIDAAVSVLDCDTDACFEFGLDLLIAGADRNRTRRK